MAVNENNERKQSMAISQNYLEVSPAYGRDYKSKAAAESDFRAGKDFRMESVESGYAGSYCSIRDFAAGVKVQIRYRKMTMVTVVTV